MIDIVGHFGSRLSYATIAEQLVAGLQATGSLGSVTNLDDQWYIRPDLASRRVATRGKRVLLLTDPRDYLVEAMVAEYGRDSVAIFVCPNTNDLSKEHLRSCESVGRIYTPSVWCANTILSSYWKHAGLGSDLIGHVLVTPLGVDDAFSNGWLWTGEVPELYEKPIKMLHVTTDTFWPGRKGTEELLKAWSLALPGNGIRDSISDLATLTVHCLPQLYASVHQELGDLGLIDKVKLVSASLRGSTPQELFDLFAGHDILVAPSRSEGFGIMPLSALMVGMPVLTTAGTGQDQYLASLGNQNLAGWMQIPTFGRDALPGETGEAPCIRADQLALSLVAGAKLYGHLVDDVERNKISKSDWSWNARCAAWVKSLLEWET